MKQATRVAQVATDIDLDCLAPMDCARICHHVLRHLLFTRAQIPIMYDELRQHVLSLQAEMDEDDGGQGEDEEGAMEEEEDGDRGHAPSPPPPSRRTRRSSNKDRRLTLLVTQVDEMLAILNPRLFENAPHATILFLLGASISRPREVYELVLTKIHHLHDDSNGGGGGMGGGGGRRPVDAARLVLRHLVTSSASLPEGPASSAPTRIHLLIHLAARDAPCPTGCEPLWGYAPRLKSGGVICSIRVRGGGEEVGEEEDLGRFHHLPSARRPSRRGMEDDEASHGEDESGEDETRVAMETLWFQSEVVVRGVGTHTR